jgi:nucleotide-binding universal stress UspA family protein
VKTIVLGYDDGDSARRALSRAASLARELGARLVVLSVARTGTLGPHRQRTIEPVDAPPRHRRHLENARALLEGADVEAEYRVGIGEPADVILEVSEAQAADLVVVGSNDAGFLTRFLGLSVSDAVRRRAPCDVLVVP